MRKLAKLFLVNLNTADPSRSRGILSETFRGYRKPQIVPNPRENLNAKEIKCQNTYLDLRQAPADLLTVLMEALRQRYYYKNITQLMEIFLNIKAPSEIFSHRNDSTIFSLKT